jgi:hypothetical protein
MSGAPKTRPAATSNRPYWPTSPFDGLVVEADTGYAAISVHVHRFVYVTALGLLVWFAASAWASFARDLDSEMAVGAITVFSVIATAVPWALWHTRSRHRSGAKVDGDSRWGIWLRSEFDCFGGHCTGLEATVELLLPLAGLAIGTTAIGCIFDLVSVGSPEAVNAAIHSGPANR